MPVAILPSFNTGEVSPRLHSRVDLEKYGSACRVLENFVIMPYGGVNRRPGTQFMGAVKDDDRKVRLIGFNFSVTTNFVLEFGHEYVRFWSNGLPVERGMGTSWATSTVYAKDAKVTQSGSVYKCLKAHTSGTFATDLTAKKWVLETPAWVTSTAYVVGDYVIQSGTMYYCRVAHTAGTFSVDLAANKWVAQTILEEPTLYQEDDLQEFQYVQINDVMYIAHGDYPVHKLSRFADDDWRIEEVAWDYRTFRDENVDESITIAASATTGTNIKLAVTKDIFTPENIGSYYRIGNNRDTDSISMSLQSNATSGALRVLGDWSFNTNSNWIAKIDIERSYDNFLTSERIRSFEADEHDRNIATSGYEERECKLRLKISDTAAKEVGTENPYAYLEAAESLIYGVVKIKSIVTPTVKTVASVADSGSEDFFRVTCTAHGFITGQQVIISGALGQTAVNGTWKIRVFDVDKFDLLDSTFASGYTASSASVTFAPNSVATAEVVKDLESTAPTPYWSEGSWSQRFGYPRAVALHEGRLFFAGTRAQPQTVWGSFVDDFENFRIASDDDAGLSFTISSSEQNAVNWMLSHQVLMIGTNGEEWVMDSSQEGAIITPTNVQVKRQSRYGSKYMPGLLINEVALFIQRQGLKIREFVYNFQKDGYLSPDLTLLAEHVTDGGIVQVAFQQQPDAILWCVTGNGVLAGMTYERDQNVVGWHRHITDGEIESVATIYGDDTADEVWISVKRTVDGETRRYVERFDPLYRQTLDDGEKANWYYVDCGVTVADETPFTAVDGLDHLEGKTVSILADGSVHPDRVVEGGEITLAYEANKVQVGLPFVSTLQPMPLEIQLPDGTAQGRMFRVNRVGVRFYKSLGGELEVEPGVWDHVVIRMLSDEMDSSPEPFTGEKEIMVASPYSNGVNVVFRQRQPLPMTLLALIPKFDVYGE